MTLAFIEGLLSPAHLLILGCPMVSLVGIAFLVYWLVMKAQRSGPNADLERRRKELEIERMAIENEERRRKLERP